MLPWAFAVRLPLITIIMIHSNESNRRLPAEWEPQSAVQLTFPHRGTDWADQLDNVLPCFLEIAATISRFQQVWVVCEDILSLRNRFYGNLDRMELIEIPNNDTWARDHSAITIIEDDRPVLLDFVFNGWGLKFPADKDNLIPARTHQTGLWDAPIRHGGMVLEGGAIESDGQGTLLTTSACLLSPNRNPHMSQSKIEAHLKDLFGLKRILWLNHGYLAGDDTDSHIDTLARFCDASTIAYVCCSDPADEHFDALHKMETELRAFRTMEDKPYRLVALPMPDAQFDETGERLPATYANFLIINGAVLVPTYQVPQDAAALEIFKEIFPDREIIGIDCNPLILQHGSLHCVTMQYPVNLM